MRTEAGQKSWAHSKKLTKEKLIGWKIFETKSDGGSETVAEKRYSGTIQRQELKSLLQIRKATDVLFCLRETGTPNEGL